MKKTLLALAVAGAFSGAAFAQSSVTLSGIVDQALYQQKKGDDSTLMLGSRKDTSRFTLSGNEDLGGGLSAVFFLQQRFQPDTGAAQTSGNQFFLSSVGVAGGFGTVTFGKHYAVTDDAGWDIGNGFNVGNWAVLDTTVQNSIKWTSANFSGFTVRAIYGLGEVAGKSSLGRWSGIGFTYEQGPIWVAFGYDNRGKDTDGTTLPTGTTVANSGSGANADKSMSLSGTYDLGVAKIGLGYTRDDGGEPDKSKQNTVNVGATIPFGKASVGVEFGQVKNVNWVKNDKKTAFALNFGYSLSARTSVYGGLTNAKTKYDAGGDYKETAVGVGINHKF